MSLHHVLSYLGLSEKQAQIYLTLLKLGTASVSQIATHAKIKRPTVYVVLETLRKRQLVSRSSSGPDRLFSAVKPDQLKQLFESRLTEFQDALPALHHLVAEQVGRPQIQVFEGSAGLIASWKEYMHHPGEILYISDVDTLLDQFSSYLEDIILEFRRTRHPYRELIGNTRVSRRYARISAQDSAFRQIRLLDGPVTGEIVVYGDTVNTTSFQENNLFVVSIKNAQIAQTYRATFEQAWKSAKKVR